MDRREFRIPCHFPVIFLLGKSPVGGQVMDIGDGGVFIASHEPVRQGAPLRLAFYLPSIRPRLMEVEAAIAWLNEEGKRVNGALPTGFGVEFRDLDERQLAALKAYLEAETLSRSGRVEV